MLSTTSAVVRCGVVALLFAAKCAYRHKLDNLLVELDSVTETATENAGGHSDDKNASTHSAYAAKIKANVATGISQQMSYLLQNEIAAEDKQAIRRHSLVSALERHGVSLEKQLQWFALDTVAKSGLFENAVEIHERILAEEPVPEEPVPDVPQDLKKRTAKKWQKVKRDMIVKKKTDNFADQLRDDLRVETFLEFAGQDLANVNTDELREDAAIFREVEDGRLTVNASMDDKFNRTMSAPPSVGSAAYANWKKAQAHRKTHWTQKIFDRLKDRPAADQETMDKMKEVFSKVLTVNDKLSQILGVIEKYSFVDWDVVEAYKKSTPWEAFKHFVVHAARATWEGGKRLRKRIYNSFRAMLASGDKKCTAQHQASEKAAMKSSGMKDGSAMSDSLKKIEKKQGESGEASDAIESTVNEQMGKAETMLEDKERETEGASQRLEGAVTHLKEAGERMEQDANEGQVSNESVQEVGAAMEEVAKQECEEREWWIVIKLKKLWKWLKSAAYTATPTIGVRGIGGAASVIGGGFEEVIDFWNKEIGVFAWGSAWVGMNSATAGVGGYAGVAWKGYKLDWNLEEAYQTAMYTTYGVNLGIPAIASLGASVTVALDADDSKGSPWRPDPQGCNGLVIGWGVSAGPSLPMGVDIGQARYKMITSECFGVSSLWKFIRMIWAPHCEHCTGWVERATMDSLRTIIHLGSYPIVTDLVHTLLAVRGHRMRVDGTVPDCKQPDDTWGPCANGTYQPERPEKDRCSMRSTNFRNDPVRLFETISEKITDSAKMLRSFNEKWDKFKGKIEGAMAVNEHVLESKEMEEFVKALRDNDIGCLRAPAENLLTLTSGSVEVKQGKYTVEGLEKATPEQLYEECRSVVKCKKHLRKSKKTYVTEDKQGLIQKLLKASRFTTSDKPFGTCSKQVQCQDSARGSPWMKKILSEANAFDRIRGKSKKTEELSRMLRCECPYVSWLDCVSDLDAADCHRACPGLSGNCACAPGWCYAGKWQSGGGGYDVAQPTGFCVKDEITKDENMLNGIREDLGTWVRLREFEVGNAAKHLKNLINSATVRKASRQSWDSESFRRGDAAQRTQSA